jgi:hypothetical protein
VNSLYDDGLKIFLVLICNQNMKERKKKMAFNPWDGSR